jgi:arsenate reductase-like glutaredoxin family protein
MATVGGKEVTIYKKPKSSIFKKAAKTIVKKGIKFAVSPLSLGLTAGTILYKGAKNQKGINFVTNRQFDKRGRKII